MRFYWLALGALGAWRVTHLLATEDGPWDLVLRLRRRAGAGFWASLMDCFYCLSLWISVPFAAWIGKEWRERILLWPALSGAAILLERLSSHYPDAAPKANLEDEDHQNVLLRQGKSGTEGNGSEPNTF
jgi:hypothetical protein